MPVLGRRSDSRLQTGFIGFRNRNAVCLVGQGVNCLIRYTIRRIQTQSPRVNVHERIYGRTLSLEKDTTTILRRGPHGIPVVNSVY